MGKRAARAVLLGAAFALAACGDIRQGQGPGVATGPIQPQHPSAFQCEQSRTDHFVLRVSENDPQDITLTSLNEAHVAPAYPPQMMCGTPFLRRGYWQQHQQFAQPCHSPQYFEQLTYFPINQFPGLISNWSAWGFHRWPRRIAFQWNPGVMYTYRLQWQMPWNGYIYYYYSYLSWN